MSNSTSSFDVWNKERGEKGCQGILQSGNDLVIPSSAARTLGRIEQRRAAAVRQRA